jgi:ribonuclease HI
MSVAFEVFTDGACAGNPGPGGWAWATSPDGALSGSGGEAHSTNQRMEVQAVLEALRTLDGELTIVSDSTYVVNCFRDRWWVKWKSNGWKNSKKEPVANLDLWQPLIELVIDRKPTFRWVKGHSGNPMNDLVDELAVAASKGPFTAVAAASSPSDMAPQDRLF